MTLRFTLAADGGFVCGDITAASPDEFLAAIDAATKLSIDNIEQPECSSDGYVRFRAILTLGDEVVADESGWRLCGWLPPGAHADLDGSGLQVWGDARRWTEWRVLDRDGQGSGDAEVLGAVRVAYLSAARELWQRVADGTNGETAEMLADALVDAAQAFRCDWSIDVAIPEPAAEAVYREVDVADQFPIVSAGRVCDCPIVAIEDDGRFEFVAHPDADDIQRLMRQAARGRPGVEAAADILASIADEVDG